jgi:uncharacterized membrane protein
MTSARKVRTGLDGVAATVENATALDAPANAVAALVDRLLPTGPVRALLSGEPLGHPAHPMLVTVPIGSWVAATVLDLTRGDAKAAQRLVALGCVSALPAVATGANDLLSTSGAQRRVGLVHAALNDVALGCYVASWRARRRGSRLRGSVYALAGAATVSASGWLGGHLSYALGAGQTESSPTGRGASDVRELRPA